MKWHDEMEKIWDNMIAQQKELIEEPEMPEKLTDLALNEVKQCGQYVCANDGK